MPQSFTPTDTAVIQRARRKRREVIVLREDADWLREYSASPKDMVRRMARRGSLIRIGAGRYAIPTIGSASPDFKAWQPMLDARLAPLGDYYLGGLSALVEHRLTDLSASSAFVVAGFWHSALAAGDVTVAGRAVRACVTRRSVFGRALGVQLVELGRGETYRRSDATRTLVDCLWHPEISGPPETWITAWGRGAGDLLDPDVACQYARALGPSTACRVGLMLDLVGYGSIAREHLAGERRLARPALLVGRGRARSEGAAIDATWNVVWNVPRDRVEGWLSYGK
jgi:predicted transcriptional regulator of viral defense system